MPRRDKPGHHSIAADYFSLADPDLSAANVRLPHTETHALQRQRVGRLQATYRVRLDRAEIIHFPRPHQLENSAIDTLPFSIARAAGRYLYCHSSWLIPFLSSASVIVGVPSRSAVFGITKETSMRSISCVADSQWPVVDYCGAAPENRSGAESFPPTPRRQQRDARFFFFGGSSRPNAPRPVAKSMSALCQKRIASLEGAECARLLHGRCAATPGHLHMHFYGHSRAAIFLEGGVELG